MHPHEVQASAEGCVFIDEHIPSEELALAMTEPVSVDPILRRFDQALAILSAIGQDDIRQLPDEYQRALQWRLLYHAQRFPQPLGATHDQATNRDPF